MKKAEYVQTKDDFFEWLKDYMCDGDTVRCEEQEDETLSYMVYNQCDELLYTFNEKTGLR